MKQFAVIPDFVNLGFAEIKNLVHHKDVYFLIKMILGCNLLIFIKPLRGISRIRLEFFYNS